MPVEAGLGRDNQFFRRHAVKTRALRVSPSYLNLSLGTSRALAAKPHTLPSPKLDHRRSRMESPIEVVRRFCAAWSDNRGAAELAAFFTEDAVYHNIPQAPVTGRQN